MTYVATVLILAASGAVDDGALERRVSIGNDASSVETFSLSDGHSLLLVGPETTMKRIAPQLRVDGRVRVRALPDARAELFLRAPTPLQSVTSKKGVLAYRVADRRALIVQHLSNRSRKPLPSEYTFKFFRKTENQIARGQLRSAEKKLERMKKKDELAEFARLRLADIAFMKGDTTSACAEYAQLVRDNEKSAAGTLAALRSHSILCPGSGYERLAWERLLEHILRIGGEVGDALWSEAMWTLGLAESVDAMRVVISLIEPHRADGDYPMGGVDILRRNLLGRLLWRTESPIEIAKTYIAFAAEIGRHPEHRHLELVVARAFLENGLPERAATLLETLVHNTGGDRAWQARNGVAQAHRELVDAYSASGWPALARDVAESYAALYGVPVPSHARVPGRRYVTPVESDLERLESRIAVVERFMRGGGEP